MLDRGHLDVFILGGLSLLWLGWGYARRKVAQSISVKAAPGVPTLLYFSADYCAPANFGRRPLWMS
jgi:hypothetical protein